MHLRARGSNFSRVGLWSQTKQIHLKTREEIEKREEDLERTSNGDFLPRTRVGRQLVR